MKNILSAFFTLLISAAPLVSQNDVTWTSSFSISSSGVDASDPRIGIDSNGNVIAAWVESGNVITRPHTGGSWGTDTALTSSGLASDPRLVVDVSGNITAIWIDNSVIYSASLPFGGSWSSPVALSASTASSPAMYVDSSGNIVAIWIGSGNIESATLLVGGSWPAAPDTLSTTGDSPEVSIGNSGTVVAVWHEVVASVDTIFSANKLLSVGTWSAGAAISNSSFNSVYPRVAVDPNGNATAGWYRYALNGTTYSNVAFQAVSLPNGGTWGTPMDLSQIGIANLTKMAARLSYDSFGNAIAMWLNSYDGISYNAESAIKRAGQNWTSSVTAVSDVFCYSLDVVANPLGDTFLMTMGGISNSFTNALGMSINIASSETNIWGDLMYIANYPNNAWGKIAASSNGTNNLVAAAWVNYNGTNLNIQAATGNSTVIQPPTGLSVTQNANDFGVFVEYENTLSWISSSDPNVVAYFVYRNGLLLTIVNSATTSITDYNRTTTETVVYGVTSAYSTGFESAPATITFP